MTDKIEKIWACLTTTDQGEGICAVKLQGSWMPLVAGDLRKLQAILEMAEEMAKDLGLTIHVTEFSQRNVVHIFEPVENNDREAKKLFKELTGN